MVPKPKGKITNQRFQKAVLEIRDALNVAVKAAEELSGKECGYRNMEPLEEAIEKIAELREKYWSLLVWEHEI